MAVTEQVPEPDVIVTVIPETEQAPAAEKVTAPKPEPPAEPTVNVVPYGWAVEGTPVTVNAAWAGREAPASPMLCVFESVFRELSVMMKDSDSAPVTVGSNSMASVQAAPASSEKDVVQSAGVPGPGA